MRYRLLLICLANNLLKSKLILMMNLGVITGGLCVTGGDCKPLLDPDRLTPDRWLFHMSSILPAVTKFAMKAATMWREVFSLKIYVTHFWIFFQLALHHAIYDMKFYCLENIVLFFAEIMRFEILLVCINFMNDQLSLHVEGNSKPYPWR